MSLIAAAVKKAGDEKEKSKRSPIPFLMASALFLLTVGAAAAVYFYEESRVDDLQKELRRAQAPLDSLTRQNEALRKEKAALEESSATAAQKDKQRIDELLGKARVLQYEKDTLEADNAQKEKKIAELGGQIDRQDERESSLMSLLEEAKKQLAAKPPSAPAALPANLPAAAPAPADASTPAPAAQTASKA